MCSNPTAQLAVSLCVLAADRHGIQVSLLQSQLSRIGANLVSECRHDMYPMAGK